MRRIPINLASEPIEAVRRARRVVAITAALIGAVTLIHLAMLGWALAGAEERPVDAGPAVPPETLAAWQDEVARLTSVADVLRARRAAGAVQVGDQLIAWRTIPWSALFADLETLLPDRVRLEAVQPGIDSAGRVRVSMTAAASDSGPLQDLMIALETSPRFRDVLPQREDTGQDGLLRIQLWAYYVSAAGPTDASAADPEERP